MFALTRTCTTSQGVTKHGPTPLKPPQPNHRLVSWLTASLGRTNDDMDCRPEFQESSISLCDSGRGGGRWRGELLMVGIRGTSTLAMLGASFSTVIDLGWDCRALPSNGESSACSFGSFAAFETERRRHQSLSKDRYHAHRPGAVVPRGYGIACEF